MSQLVNKAEYQIKEIVISAAKKCVAEGAFESVPETAFSVDTPSDRAHGDFAVNAALCWAKVLRSAPRVIAEKLVGAMNFEDTYI